ncbi:MAG TPA: oxidoreductase [Terriglobales bacterium]
MLRESEERHAILLGASGLVGGFCLQALLAEPVYSRIVLLNRRELKVGLHPQLIQRVVDFEKMTVDDFAKADDILCALGTTIRKAGSQAAFRRVDVEYPLTAAKLARAGGAKQFLLVSSTGADPASKNFYLRTKGDLEQEIGKLGFQALHVFRPSLLLGQREEFRLAERVVQAIAPAVNLVMFDGLRRYRAIKAAAVGKAMVVAAREESKGVFVHEYDEILRLAA